MITAPQDPIAQLHARLDRLERELKTLASSSQLGNSSISSGTLNVRRGRDGPVVAQAGVLSDGSIGISSLYQGALTPLPTALDGLRTRVDTTNNRMNPGGDMYNWATSISNAANGAASTAGTALAAANRANNRMDPGGDMNNYVAAVATSASGARTAANAAQSTANAAQSAANAAQNTANAAANAAAAADAFATRINRRLAAVISWLQNENFPRMPGGVDPGA